MGRASRIYQKLEKALEDSEPESMELSTRQAYQFLREFAAILGERGFGIATPVLHAIRGDVMGRDVREPMPTITARRSAARQRAAADSAAGTSGNA